MIKLLVLGYFGYNTNQLDGQTIKTRNLYDLLRENFSYVSYFDTQDFRYNIFSVFKMLFQVCKSDVVCYVPAHNNLKYIFPIIFVISKLCFTKIQYYVVGGWLNEFIRDLPVHRLMLKHISAIFPETTLMREILYKDFHIVNTRVFPNFRITDFTPKPVDVNEGQLRLVFMARVNKMKGYDVVFSFAKYAMKHKLDVIIDFYGPINDDDKADFESLISICPITQYKGILEPAEIYQVMSKYDILLLPTKYYTEGFPGTILDAYISGVPVIVTEWKHAHEFVVDGETGFIVPFDDPQDAFNEKLLTLYHDRFKLNEMRAYSCNFSESFKAGHALRIIKEYI